MLHLSEQLDHALERDDWEHCDGTPEEARQLANILKNALSQYEHISAECERLKVRSQTIVPIYLRTQPLLEPVQGVMLCDYDVGSHKFRSGDRVTVVNNWAPFNSNFIRRSSSQRPQSSQAYAETTVIPEVEDEEVNDRKLAQSSSFVQSINQPSDAMYSPVQTATPYWCVCALGEQEIRVVPAVTVCLIPSAPDTIRTIEKMKEQLRGNWKETIDRLLNAAGNVLRQFLHKIIDSGLVMVTDRSALKRLFALIAESYPCNRHSEMNADIAGLVDAARATITEIHGATPGRRGLFLRRSDIAQYMSVIATLRMHMHKSERLESQCASATVYEKLQEKQDAEMKRMILAVNAIDEVARLDFDKVQKLLVELRRLKNMDRTGDSESLLKSGLEPTIRGDCDNFHQETVSESVLYLPPSRGSTPYDQYEIQPVPRQATYPLTQTRFQGHDLHQALISDTITESPLARDEIRSHRGTGYSRIPFMRTIYSRSTSVTRSTKRGSDSFISHTQSSWVSAPISPGEGWQNFDLDTSFNLNRPVYHSVENPPIPSGTICAQTQTDLEMIPAAVPSIIDQADDPYSAERIRLIDIRASDQTTQSVEDDEGEEYGKIVPGQFSQPIISPL
ncbi:unnamed protein product [Echinostoma caproni]|uniref:SH3_10 domain-containing protein n=1 Tax=Echinostoma caproni TaxID=27848 RepID=A0A3P8GVS3_9TREM|nr:unnamed protein product [Echinostoma caproni]